MGIRMSVARCCCVGCANHTCWYDDFTGYTIGNDIVEIPVTGLNSSSKPYSADPVGGVGGAFIPDTTGIVASGGLIEIKKFNYVAQANMGISKGWGVSDQADLHGGTYSDKSVFSWTVDSWDRDTDSTNEFTFGVMSQVRFYIVESGSTFTPYFGITKQSDGFHTFYALPSMSHPSGILSKFEIELYDGSDEGAVGGGGGQTKSSFEWKALIDGVIVLESMTGATRNYERTLLITSDWCSLPVSSAKVFANIDGSDPTLTLSEWRISIKGDDSCVP